MIEPTKNRYTPDFVSRPGDTLIELLEEREMSQAELSRRMGRPKKTINEIIQGKASITPETALQLEKVLDVPAHFWSNRQQQYDQHLAVMEERGRLSDQVDWLDKFPVKQMLHLGWIEEHSDKVSQLSELLRFFGIASPGQWQPVGITSLPSFRKTSAYESEVEHISVWLRMGEIIGTRRSCAEYNENLFRQLLTTKFRALTMEPPEIFVPQLTGLCSQVGVVVAFIPQLQKARVSGATRWLSSKKALIQLSLRYKKDDQLWFSFFHEAAHILLHGKRDIFIEGESIETNEKIDKEAEADRFAANVLIPNDMLEEFLGTLRPDRYPSKSQIVEFAERIGVSPGIVVGRLQHDQLPEGNPIPYTHYHDLKHTLEWSRN